MIEKKNDLKSNFRGRSSIRGEQAGNWTPANKTDKAYHFFGLERGNRFVRRFKLLLRDGREFSVPYAYLPIILYDPDRNLIIRTGDVEITIVGRSLKILADWLNEEKVLWIKESESGIDDEDDEVFILSISVDGELMI